jgi:hypothetical protein
MNLKRGPERALERGARGRAVCGRRGAGRRNDAGAGTALRVGGGAGIIRGRQYDRRVGGNFLDQIQQTSSILSAWRDFKKTEGTRGVAGRVCRKSAHRAPLRVPFSDARWIAFADWQDGSILLSIRTVPVSSRCVEDTTRQN